MNRIPIEAPASPLIASKIPMVRPELPPLSEIESDIQDILTSGMVTKGRHLQDFEQAVADHLEVKHAIGVSSCTTGLMLTYQGLKLTGEVVVPSFTFMATVSALVWAGLRPVFADVDAKTMTLDPSTAEHAVTDDTSAIIAVHNFGNPADIEALQAIANKRGLRLIFDAAHGFGSLYKGRPVGTQGDAQVYSLSPTKLLIAGEGGIVATNDDELADKIRIGREYGNTGNYDSAFAGINARLAEFNCVLGLQSLKRLEEAAVRRNEVVALYRKHLRHIPGIGFQEIKPGNRCSYKDFSITIDYADFGQSRDDLARALTAENVDTRKYYDPPVHRQSAYVQYDDKQPLPKTEMLAKRCLSLPVWSQMHDDTVLSICAAVQRCWERNDRDGDDHIR